MRLPIPLLLLALLPAATWHVATNGDDKADGTEAAPFRTVQRGAEAAQAGDTVFVHEGVYRERVAPPRGGAPGNPIRFEAEPGKNVILKGSELWAPEWQKEGALYTAIPPDSLWNDDCYLDDKNPFKVELSTTPFGREGRREVERGWSGDKRLVYVLGQVFVDGETYRQVPLKEEAAEGMKTWWAEPETGRLFVHFPQDPAGKSVELTARRRVFAPHRRGLGYLHLTGFVFEHAAGQYPCDFWKKEHAAWQQAGLVGTRSGHHWELRSNVIRQGMVGLDFGYEALASQDRGDLERGSNGRAVGPVGFHLLEGNRICDNLGPGTAAMAATGVRIIGNVVERNNRMGFTGRKRYETAGLKLHTPHGALLSGNLVRSNRDCPGIWLDGGSGTNTLVTGNLVIGNGKGFDLEIGAFPAASCVLADNVFLDNESIAVSAREGGGLLAMNNLIAGPGYGYRILGDVKREGKWSAAHHWSFGNLFLGCTTMVQAQTPSWNGRGDLFGDRRFDWNLYGMKEGETRFSLLDVPDRLSFEDWKAAWGKRTGAKDSDAHSIASPVGVAFDAQALRLGLFLPAAPPVSPFVHPRAIRRYAGGTVSGPRSAGPFPSLARGSNHFELWSGVRPLAEYELPYGGSERRGPIDLVASEGFEPGSNLLVNGDFSLGTNAWLFSTSEGAEAMAAFQEGAFRALITRDGPKEWSLQLRQSGLPLARGTYVLVFEARADAPRLLKPELIQEAMPQRPFLRQTVGLTTAWKTFRFEFAVGAPERNARLHFRMGTLGTASVELRSVSLVRLR
ncbi:MAG: carbohydrate binding domain-containing protein [Spirochaetes bacterium]|nr:carbohydrate binding domain-containing protein [Spirochaetota bacterium]